MQGTTVFFRDDDVGEMTDPLRAVLETLLEASIPCHYQVVPGYLDAGAAEALTRLQQDHPDLIFLDQHGFRHEQMLGGRRRPTEFAGGRPFEEQLADITQGRQMLEERLGKSFQPSVFTPPCHKFDAATLRVLGDLGFGTVSAGVRSDPLARLFYGVGRRLGRVELLGGRVSYHGRPTPDPRLVEVSVAIDVHEDVDRSGRRRDKTSDELWAEFEALRGRLPEVGVMLHHQACDTAEKQTALRDFVDRLRGDPGVRISRIGELARVYR